MYTSLYLPSRFLNCSFAQPPLTVAWGRGVLSANQAGYGEFEGGIFMASNISNSCTVWNAEVEHSHIGKLGSLEHLRSLLGKGASVAAGELIWITDRTPHESLPLPASTDCALCKAP